MAPRRTAANKAQDVSVSDLLGLMAKQLQQQSRKPNILGYQPHAKQRLFHQMDEHLRLYIGGNRCLALGTEVLMADGSVKPIEEIREGDYVIAADGTATQVVATWYNGEREVREYSIGRYQDRVSVICTPDHKFLAAYETHGVLNNPSKLPIKDLVNRRGRHKIKRSGGTRLGGKYEPKAYVLGLMLGDGYLPDSSPSQLQFTCADESLVACFPEFTPRRDPIQYGFSKDTREVYFDWFKSLGILGCLSATKFIPKEVWSWSEWSIRELCAGLIVTDGSLYVNQAGESHVAYCSNSLSMITEFRRLMGIRLGIWGSTITYESRGTYSVTYGTREALEKIAELPIKGVKEAKIDKLATKRNSFSSYVGVHSSTAKGLLPTYDITVAHESHAFMLANGLITSNSGKSYGAVAEDIWWASGTHPYLNIAKKWPGEQIRGRVVGVDFDRGVKQIILPLFKTLCPSTYLRKDSWTSAWERVGNGGILHFKYNDSYIEFLSYEQDMDKFAGTSRHFNHFDEEPPKNIYQECGARLIDTNGYAWFSMTPVSGMTWVYEDLYDPANEAEDKQILVEETGHVGPVFISNYSNGQSIGVIEVATEENPHLSEEARERYFSTLDEDERAARSKGKFVQVAGKVFKTFTVETHVTKEDFDPRAAQLKGWQIYSSTDHGWNAPTAWLWHAVAPEPDGQVITFAEHYKSEMTIKEHSDVVRSLEEGWSIDRSEILRTGDPAMAQHSAVSGTSILQEYAKNDIYIYTDSVPKDPKIGTDRMQSYFRLRSNGRPMWMISDNCPNLISELRKLRWAAFTSQKVRDSNNPQERVHKLNDHAFDSSKYFATFLPDLAPEIQPSNNAGLPSRGTMTYDEALSRSLAAAKTGTEWSVIEYY